MRQVTRAGIMAGVLAILVGALVALGAMTALGHDDGGVDEPFIAPDMNQPSYWEARFPGADCTKYENHSGTIPSWVDIAIVHDGQYVRVYNPAPSFVLGPHNPNTGNHFGAPHSWVMKCTVEDDTTTTTTMPETTTTTVEVTTTTQGDETTTTSQPEATTTTVVDDTTTTESQTTTSEAPTTTNDNPTTLKDPAEQLPYTGISEPFLWVLVGSLCLGAGVAFVLRAGRG